MLSIKIICVGKLKDRFYIDGAGEYNKRLSGYCKTEILEIPEQRLPDSPSDAEVMSALNKECAAIEDKIAHGATVIALCVEGEEYTSAEFSRIISDFSVNGVSKICFIIGGSYGLHDRIKDRASIKLSLSRMTLPHNFARVILLEQIYRAFKIMEGGKYHK